MHKPKILIVAEDGYAKNIPHFMINLTYGKVISEVGGLPIVALNPRLAEEYAELEEERLPYFHTCKTPRTPMNGYNWSETYTACIR